MHVYRCHESDQKAKFQQKQILPSSQYTVPVFYISIKLPPTPSHCKFWVFLKESWWCWAGGEESVSTANTHPREKLGQELGCALSYLTTAPAAPEIGTWNLGNKARGVKFVSTARVQWSGRWSWLFPCSFGPQLYHISPTFHDLHQWSEPFFLWSCEASDTNPS